MGNRNAICMIFYVKFDLFPPVYLFELQCFHPWVKGLHQVFEYFLVSFFLQKNKSEISFLDINVNFLVVYTQYTLQILMTGK